MAKKTSSCSSEQQKNGQISIYEGYQPRSLILMLLLIGGVESNPGPIELETLEIAALGRPFHLGMLYDARSDKTIPAVTLWDTATLQQHLQKEDNRNVKVEVLESDTLSDKATALSVSAELKLSFLSGLIEISGSGSYMKDHCDTATQERITLQYKSTSYWEKLGMEHLSKSKMEHLDIFGHKTATHVVTQIEYGADAYFLFDRERKTTTDKTQVGGSLKAEVNAIKAIAAGSVAAAVDVKANEKTVSENVRCTFYGDFSLDRYPTSISEARTTIQELHKQLHTKPVPKTIWLYPLALLNDQATKLLARISVNLLSDTEVQLQALIDTYMAVTGMLEQPDVQQIGALKKELTDYKKHLKDSKLLFQEKLQTILPEIRGGSGKEADLAKILETWNKSVFSPEKMSLALSDFKEEVAWLKERLWQIENSKIDMLAASNEISEGTAPTLSIEFNIADFRGSLIEQCKEFLENPFEGSEIEEIAVWYGESELRSKSARNIDRFLTFVASARKGDSIAAEEDLQPARFFCAPNKPKTKRGKRIPESPVSIVVYNNSTGKEIELPFFDYPPKVTNVTSDSAEITIQLPSKGLENILSVIVLAKNGDNEYKVVKKQKREEGIEKTVQINVDNLVSSSSYFFKIQALTPWGIGPASSMSSRVETAVESRLAVLIKSRATLVPDSQWKNTKIYVPEKVEDIGARKESQTGTGGVRKFQIGGKQVGVREQEKIILVTGGTGAGKTTFLNSLVNVVYSVKLENDFRFRLASEEDESSESGETKSTSSKTKWVTAYVLNNTNLNYKLTVVDTPGFGDTKGIQRDKETTKLLKEWFQQAGPDGLDRLDAVCIVVKGSETRLTEQVKYELNNVVALFGMDMASNILPLFTFCGSSEPTALQSLRDANIPFEKYFMFDNGAFFEGKNMDAYQKLAWQKAIFSFEKFFDGLNMLRPRSLALTKETCEKRDMLEQQVIALQYKVEREIEQLNRMQQECEVIKKHEADVEGNKNFTYTVQEEYEYAQYWNDGRKTTTCQHCKWICFEYWDPSGYENCWVCPGKCAINRHSFNDHIMRVGHREVQKTYDALKEKYGKATEDKNASESMLNNLADQFLALQGEINNTIKETRKCLADLDKIAMRKSQLTESGYIEIMISNEKTQMNSGWAERVKHLEYQLKIAKSIETANDPKFDPLAQYKTTNEGKFSFLKKRFPQIFH